jgi:hypothetical protein
MLAESSDQISLTLQSVGKTPMIQLILLDSLSQHDLVYGFSDNGS